MPPYRIGRPGREHIHFFSCLSTGSGPAPRSPSNHTFPRIARKRRPSNTVTVLLAHPLGLYKWEFNTFLRALFRGFAMTADHRPLIVATAGDPAGVGPEIVVQAALDPDVQAHMRVCVVGERTALLAAGRALELDLALDVVDAPDRGSYEPITITVVDTGTVPQALSWGEISAQGGVAAFAAVKTALGFLRSGAAAAMATAPIHKESLRMGTVPYIDHTSMLKGLTGAPDVMTMFATGKLRIFFLTRHIALREVSAALTIEGVRQGIHSSVSHLATLGIKRPRLAVAALNPHGGEHGLFGDEEEDVLKPAIAQAQAETEAEVVGPIPADAIFHQGAEGAYDAVLSLYHDQGHIAAKTLDFHGTVSFTLGLPFLRTSVDHGTAFDIAGRGIVNAHGMKEALQAAATYAVPYRVAKQQ